MTLRPASLASWMPIEPTPPAPPMMRIDLPASLPPRSIFMRSKNASQAVIAVSGMAAACAKSRRLRLSPDDALVDEMELAVRAGARDVAGVVHLVARLEQRHFGTDGFDGAGGVPAEDARRGRLGFPLLGVDRVDRDRFDLHQEVAPGGRGLGLLDFLKRMDDGFHRCSMSSSGWRMMAAACQVSGPPLSG